MYIIYHLYYCSFSSLIASLYLWLWSNLTQIFGIALFYLLDWIFFSNLSLEFFLFRDFLIFAFFNI